MLALAALLVMQFDSAFAPRPVSFSHVPPKGTTSVSVVGGFNTWDRAACPLKPGKDGKIWRGTFSIAPGVYPYLFVEDGKKWVKDPKAPSFPDSNGNVNGKLVVQPLDYDERPASPDDDLFTLSPIRHRPDPRDSVLIESRVARIKVRTRRRDVKSVGIEYGPVNLRKAHGRGKVTSMELVAQDELFDTWAGKMDVELGGPTEYLIFLNSGTAGRKLGPSGIDQEENFRQDFNRYPLPNPPAWVQDAIFYQIFPERFANGDLKNDGPGVQPWGTKPTAKNRMGGDLEGIRRNLSHIQALGANSLYLNPIFTALSSHAYDTVDYEAVDPRFGTLEDLKQLSQALKNRQMRLILDGVFNHSSPEFFAFKDVVEKGRESRFKDWFFLMGFPVEVVEGQKMYRTFAGVPTMPKLNQDNEACGAYFRSIGEKWIKEVGIDGWRLDVADEVSQSFWRDFRKTVKKADSEALIFGEVWGDAHEYLQGDQFDSVMNYRFRKAVLDFLAYRTIDLRDFEGQLARTRDDYPAAIQTSLFNLLGSHDTERLRTIFRKDRQRERLAVLLQFTYPGVPSIYYGDEIGMEGGRDPDCRRCMEWDRSKWDTDTFEFYKMLTGLRTKRESLRRGGYWRLKAPKDVLMFERKVDGEATTVLLNTGTRSQTIKIDTNADFFLVNGVLQREGVLTVRPLGFAVFDSSEE